MTHTTRTFALVSGLALALALVLVPIARVRAQTPGASTSAADDAEARMLFDAGTLAYDAGRFEDALARFTEAYRLSNRASLLWNIALAADRARQDETALETYRRFLADTPETESVDLRARAVDRVAVIEASMREARDAEERAEQAERDRAAAEQGAEDARAREAAAREAAQVATDANDSSRLVRKWWFWTIVGTGVVTAVAVPVALTANRDSGQPFPRTDSGTVILAISGRF